MVHLPYGQPVEGCPQLYFYSDCPLLPDSTVKELDLSSDSRDEGRQAYFLRSDGDGGCIFPEKITVGENSIIGYNTTILAHEYLIKEYRLGEVVIGENVLIGANTTILPGVTIGDWAVVAAGSVVHKNVAAGSFVGGNPLRELRPASSEDSSEQV